MAYFLKKSNLKKGTYLQIYESFYDPSRGHTAHRSIRPIGYVHELQANGCEDPISFYKDEIQKMNDQRNREKKDVPLISEDSPEKLLGYFPLKNINDSSGVRSYLDLMQSVTDYQFNLYDLLSALVYARVVKPCSKRKTIEFVLPKLFDDYSFSSYQVYEAVEYIGSEYEKIIEIYNHCIQKKYPFDTSHTYFDCTNFYFEIDREDDFRRKGPSKENRRDPIVGMGLLLDANQIPIGMKLYPGNQSEIPVIREVIDDLKSRNNITGRTIQIADKGLNCIDNILFARKNNDGYIFSKSVKRLDDVEREWVLLENDYKVVKDKNGKILYKIKEWTDDFNYTATLSNGKKKKVSIYEKRVATYNPSLAEKQKYEINKLIQKAENLKLSQAKKSEYGECAKYVTFTAGETDEKVKVTLNTKAIEKSLKCAGYNLLVTSETKMSAQDIYHAYHNLWRIEESFKVMKSQLDARPVHMQKRDSITGHFLICYLAIVLTRLLQIHVLNNEYGSEQLFQFFKDYRVVKVSERKYINLTRKTEFITQLTKKTSLPLSNYFLSLGDIKKVLNHRF